MQLRAQQTIERVTELSGFGLFTNADVTVRFLPAGENHGIVFQRIDLAEAPCVPASVEFLAAEDRRTKLVSGAAKIEMTEHLMSAFAGLQIDNCLVQINAPELPGCDGSALPYAEALLNAGIVPQTARKDRVQIPCSTLFQDENSTIHTEPFSPGLRISYELNYGGSAPIPAQLADFIITPELFLEKIAPSRTFVLEQEIEYLRSKGYGQKVTYQDLLVFNEAGPIDNSLRSHNECARHKLLDCLGDLALCGGEIVGHIKASRSGHRHNHQVARYLRQLLRENNDEYLQRKAA